MSVYGKVGCWKCDILDMKSSAMVQRQVYGSVNKTKLTKGWVMGGIKTEPPMCDYVGLDSWVEDFWQEDIK